MARGPLRLPVDPGILAIVILAATRRGLIGKALAARPLVFLGNHLVRVLPDPSTNHWIGPESRSTTFQATPNSTPLAWNPCRFFCDNAIRTGSATRLVEFPIRSKLMIAKAVTP